jgi:hypothetical protein
MYDINEETEGDRKPKFLEAGFHDVALMNIKKDKTSNGDSYLRVEFKDEKGIPFTHTEFTPSAFPGSKDPKEDVAKQIEKQQRRIKHILSKFVDESKIIIKAASFDELIDCVIEIAGDSYKGEKFRILCDYNGKGYARFPSFPPFIEVAGTEPTTLRVTEYHKMEKPVADKPSALVGPEDDASPALVGADVPEDEAGDDLPF